MIVQHHKPISKILQRHIEYYYFVKTDNSKFETKYYAFPHILTPVSIHENVEAEIKYYSVSVFESEKKNNVAFVQGMRRQPLLVSLKGKLDKCTIIFKPIGLNHFVTKSFCKICPNDTQFFEEWNENPDYREFLRKFYETEILSLRIALLEEFLLSIHSPIENQDVLEKALSMLTDFEVEQSVEGIAVELDLNIRTFNRLFRENVGISPVGFKKIARFRHSLNDKLINDKLKRLTDIAYESNFYDQSYFVRIYQQLAGSNPKQFFDSVEKVGDDKLLFQFLNR
jgi:AraC-like DNA-binding protein